MAKQTLQILKSWFVRGAKPTQKQFSDTFDSFVHKDEMIPQNKIEELSETLQQVEETVNGAITGQITDVKFGGVSLEKNAGSVNIPASDLAQNGDDCLRLNIMRVLDIGAVGNKVLIDVPEGYVCYAQTAESAGTFRYCSWVNGYNSFFTSYSASVVTKITKYGAEKGNSVYTRVEGVDTYVNTGVSLEVASGSIYLSSPGSYCIKGGTQIEIEVASTTLPSNIIEENGGVILPKILIWGTLFCFRRTVE